MLVNEYQDLAVRTLNKDLEFKDKLAMSAMGLSGEAGEYTDAIKKVLFHGHGMEKEDLIKELGDVAWYLAVSSHVLGIDLETVLIKNIEKLKKRYPEGFSENKSINRVE